MYSRVASFVLTILLVFALGCDNSPVETGQTPIGVWQIADPAFALVAEEPMHIWEFQENGAFTGINVGQKKCIGLNGEWEIRRDNLWITLYPDEENPVVFKGSYKINNREMTVVGEADKQRTVWKQSDELPYMLMFSQGACQGD